MIDECGHALFLLKQALSIQDIQNEKFVNIERALNVYDVNKFKRNLDGIREKPEIYRVLSAFSFDSYNILHKNALQSSIGQTDHWKSLLNKINEYLSTYLSERQDSRSFLTPGSRFINSALLSLIDSPLELPIWENAHETEFDEKGIFRKPDVTQFRSRRSIMANRFDPMAIMARDLGIRTYITTNYDFEIERFFQDSGYRQFSPDGADVDAFDPLRPWTMAKGYRSDSIGGVLSDETFEPDQAANLVSFALGSEWRDAAVFHLHGRATKNDSLVVTERDYMNLYLRQDEFRETTNEAISLAFGSKPILFLGLGMGEADLLRPLRQFISNRDRIMG